MSRDLEAVEPSTREILQGDFKKFIRFVWEEVLGHGPPTRIQYDIADFLAGGPPSRFIEAFRGLGKSFLTCAYVVWRLWRDPYLKIVIVSAGESGAVDNAGLIQKIIDHPAGDDLWAELRTKRGQLSSTLKFDVGACADRPDKQASVTALGITGQLPGNRSNILISDDVESSSNSGTETARDKLRRLTAEYTSIAKPDEGAEIIYLGTPQSQESIYNDLPARGYTTRIWTVRYPLRDKLANYGEFLAPLLRERIERDPSLCDPCGPGGLGGAVTDSRFDEAATSRKEIEQSAASFMLQMMLDTALSDGEQYSLKTRDFICMDVDRELAPMRVVWASKDVVELPNQGFDGDRLYAPMFVSKDDFVPYAGKVMHIDPSGSGQDETAYVVTGFLNGMIYIRRWGGFVDGKGENTLQRLADIAAEEQVNRVLIEDNWGDGMWSQLFQPVLNTRHRCSVENHRVKGRKEVRIMETLSPPLNQHRLVIDPAIIRADDLNPDRQRRGLYQLTHMSHRVGGLRYDDRVDVLAQGVGYWVGHMNIDADVAMERYREEKARKFHDKYFGVPEAAPEDGWRRGEGRRIG